jgi:pimeloyl-ACP methyl ester carboxylesterase
MTGIVDESYPPEQIHLKKNHNVDDDDTMITFEPSTNSSEYYHRIKHNRKSTSLIRKVEEEEEDVVDDPEPYNENRPNNENLEGWKEESESSNIRNNRSIFRRKVTLYPRKPVAPPKKKTLRDLALEMKKKEEQKNNGGLFGKVMNDWKNTWKALNLLPSDDDDDNEEEKSSSNRSLNKRKNDVEGAAASLLLWDPLLGQLPAAPDTNSMTSEKDSPTKLLNGRVEYDSQSGTLRDSFGNQLSSAPLFQKSLDDVPIAHILMIHGSCGSSAHFQNLLLALHHNLCVDSTTTNSKQQQPNTSMDAYSTANVDDDDDDDESIRTTRMLLQHFNGRPIQCHLFDTFGCGKSTNQTTDWEAFSHQEIAKDLETVFQSIIDSQNDDDDHNNRPTTDASSSKAPIFLVGHAHGSSQIIDLINGLSNHQKSYIKGAVFISGALSDGPVDQISESHCKGGQCIWRLPNFVLDWIQPRLMANDPFFNTSTLGASAQNLKTASNVSVAKALYRQNRWADSESAKKIRQKVLLIHGEYDHVIPIVGGKHLDDHLPFSNLVIVRESSHMVFQERSEVVSELILDFISKGLNLPKHKDATKHDRLEIENYY